MGRVKENLLTKGFSGRIGDEIVFRQIDGRTVFGKRPRKRLTLTPNQEAQRSNFQQGVYYARTVLISPARREDYAQAAKMANFKSAYIAALTDYLREPKIASVYVKDYKGVVGNSILFSAVDDFKVIEAIVTIKRADDTVIETGNAIHTENGWAYTVQQTNAAYEGCKVTFTIKDRLDKTAVQEAVVLK